MRSPVYRRDYRLTLPNYYACILIGVMLAASHWYANEVSNQIPGCKSAFPYRPEPAKIDCMTYHVWEVLILVGKLATWLRANYGPILAFGIALFRAIQALEGALFPVPSGVPAGPETDANNSLDASRADGKTGNGELPPTA